ncbi:MAG: LytR C-terminal domain-containing protein [Patescibacteria group bacterium]
MPEIQSEQEGAEQMPSDTTQDMPQTKDSPHNDSREPLWGMFLIAGMLLFVIASVAGIGWVVYTKWQSVRMAKNQLSVVSLSEKVPAQETPVAEPEPSQDMKPVADTQAADTTTTEAAKKLEISVLNGGSAKGSAGVLTEFLKTEGYGKTVPGNTLKDYVGTVIYHAASLEKEAEAIRTSVAKKYPQAKILPADASNKETSVSPVAIIIGK